MSNLSHSAKQPVWWRYSAEVWRELSSLFINLNVFSQKALCDQANWTLVRGGITNFNYRVNLQQHQYFVQVLDEAKIQRLPSQKFIPSNQVMEKNSPLNRWLVPCIYETQRLRVFEWVDAENTTLALLQEKRFEEELCDFLSELHSNISVLPILNIRQHLAYYHQLSVQRNPHKTKEFDAQYARALICAQSFSSTANCHNDLSPGNILVLNTKGVEQLKIVDWEYACISDPLFDLAGVCVNFVYSEAQEQRLIKLYSEKRAVYSNYEKFQKMKELYRLIEQLWTA